VELQRVAHHALVNGAEILVTTEKDRMNCPDHIESIIAPLSLIWLEIELVLDEEDRFFAILDSVLNKRKDDAA
jgi:tetraacyldisaccharide-1-P 4'-kinase